MSHRLDGILARLAPRIRRLRLLAARYPYAGTVQVDDRHRLSIPDPDDPERQIHTILTFSRTLRMWHLSLIVRRRHADARLRFERATPDETASVAAAFFGPLVERAWICPAGVVGDSWHVVVYLDHRGDPCDPEDQQDLVSWREFARVRVETLH